MRASVAADQGTAVARRAFEGGGFRSGGYCGRARHRAEDAPPTFSRRAEHGAARANARIVAAVYAAAEGGNSAAQRFWCENIAGIEAKPKVRQRPLGKKEALELQLAEMEKNTEWAKFLPRQPPSGLTPVRTPTLAELVDDDEEAAGSA
jgi:hypothetical protein